jgi:hypothetical protein
MWWWNHSTLLLVWIASPNTYQLAGPSIHVSSTYCIRLCSPSGWVGFSRSLKSSKVYWKRSIHWRFRGNFLELLAAYYIGDFSGSTDFVLSRDLLLSPRILQWILHRIMQHQSTPCFVICSWFNYLIFVVLELHISSFFGFFSRYIDLTLQTWIVTKSQKWIVTKRQKYINVKKYVSIG